MKPVPISVGIPTYARGENVLQVVDRVLACRPPPAEIIVHIDQSDGLLEQTLTAKFPSVRVISSANRVGPGGGRHRCLMVASNPYFASFDDDSWPVDADYFARVLKHFSADPRIACLATIIFHRSEAISSIMDVTLPVVDYVGCGYAMRVAAYRELPGHIDRKIPYGIEERDVCLQLHAAGWQVLECKDMRIFHDTLLSHHSRPEITAGTIENAALLPWLRYPISLWPYGFLQWGNVLFFLIKSRRFSGILRGIIGSPIEVWRHRKLRRPLPPNFIRSYLNLRRRRTADK